MATYNKHYQKRNYFGNPYPELLEYIGNFQRNVTILDLGCGQGRDVLAFGRMGFKVTGIDISDVGISQLNEVVKNEGLPITTEVIDYKKFSKVADYDIILMNSMFHFYKNDIEEESNTIREMLNEMKICGRLVLIVQESDFRKEHIKSIIKDSNMNLTIDIEKSFLYKEFNSTFYMIAILKSS